MKKLIIVLSLLSATAIASQAAEGKTLWDQNCAKCHGANGKGDTRMGQKLGVKDYTDPQVQSKLTDEEMTKAIKNGVTVGGKEKMKGFSDKLSDEDVKALVAHIRGFKK